MTSLNLAFSIVGMYVALLVLPLGLIYFWLKRQARYRRSSLTQKLLRGPGETLRNRLDEVRADLLINVFMLAVTPLLVYAIHVSQSYFLGEKESVVRTAIAILFAAVAVAFFLKLIFRLSRWVSKLRQGYEAEVAIAQELNQLMRLGAFVFHDVPGEGFNIDHVVVLPRGVYAVETKSRMKPQRGRGTEDATVIFDGNKLNFPEWSETKPIAQAKQQAQWLNRWLTSAVGESVRVRPALALPGWNVERQGESEVVIFSGKNATAIFSKLFNSTQSEELCKRIAHQLEQRCRDVEPKDFRKPVMAM